MTVKRLRKEKKIAFRFPLHVSERPVKADESEKLSLRLQFGATGIFSTAFTLAITNVIGRKRKLISESTSIQEVVHPIARFSLGIRG